MSGVNICPCGSGRPFDECCGKYIEGRATAPTAELLMRSRYTAYARRVAPYLLRTWHVSTRPGTVKFDPGLKWTRLEIVGKTAGGLLQQNGTVEFRAHYEHGGQPNVMHENSSFVRADGLWVYVKGTQSPPPAR
ncbi:MAG: YchJ family metal-binding protein [Kibdelosporangium sp.]